MNREQTAEIVARFIDGMDNGKLDVLADIVHADLRYITPAALPNGGTMHGARAFLDMMGRLADFYVPETISIDREPPIVDEGRAAMRFTVKATTANGNPYFNRYVMVVLAEDGKITEIDEHLDTRYLAQKMYGD
jgi:ketosteroid isomerase-like protein